MIDDIKRKLKKFFPTEIFPADDLEKSVNDGEIFTDGATILRYLQTALFDEKALEIEINNEPRVYFSRLKDDLPDLFEDVIDGKVVVLQPDYDQGSYLTEMTHILLLPVEPGLGNLHLRVSNCIVIRMFTSTFAVEMGTTFETLALVQDLPVLRLSFPVIARIVRKTREYRAKVPESLNFVISVGMSEEAPEIETTPVDIGVKGLSFTVSKAQQRLMRIDSVVTLKLFLLDELLARLDGTVKHISKIRKKTGIEYICGIEFDLQTKILASVVESIVMTVQRAHLKELAEKSDSTGIDLIA